MAQTTMFLLLAILLAIMVISTIIIIIVAKRMKRFEKSCKMQDEFYEEDSCLKEKYDVKSDRTLAIYVVCGILFLSSFSWILVILFF